MTQWNLLTKIIKDKQIELDQQIDDVGNIYQKSGGVIPKACQKCKKPFDAKVNKVPLKQKIPFYKYEDCKYGYTAAKGFDAAAGAEFSGHSYRIQQEINAFKNSSPQYSLMTVIFLWA